MKNLKYLLLAAIVAFTSFAFVSCGDDDDDVDNSTVEGVYSKNVDLKINLSSASNSDAQVTVTKNSDGTYKMVLNKVVYSTNSLGDVTLTNVTIPSATVADGKFLGAMEPYTLTASMSGTQVSFTLTGSGEGTVANGKMSAVITTSGISLGTLTVPVIVTFSGSK